MLITVRSNSSDLGADSGYSWIPLGINEGIISGQTENPKPATTLQLSVAALH